MKRIVLLLSLCLVFVAIGPSTTAPRPEIVAGFSPGGAESLVLDTIAEAKEHIFLSAYHLTSGSVAHALVEAQARGVDVQIVADAGAARSRHSRLADLAEKGVLVKLNGNHAILHHKFMVIDGMHVQTGSFNYTDAAAGRNAENVLVLRFNPKLAASYYQEWKRLWDSAEWLPRSGNIKE